MPREAKKLALQANISISSSGRLWLLVINSNGGVYSYSLTTSTVTLLLIIPNRR
jgi:hypothetical protein